MRRLFILSFNFTRENGRYKISFETGWFWVGLLAYLTWRSF